MEEIYSPITHSLNVKLVKRILPQDLINSYKESLDVQVEKYFRDTPYVYLWQCNDSGLQFYSPDKIAGDGDFYNNLNLKHDWYYQYWKWEYKISSSFLNKNDEVLEIGCGDGNFLRNIKDKVKSVTGLELNGNAEAVGNKHGIEIKNKLIQDFVKETSKRYDIVCAFQVLEHIADVKSFLTASIEILKPGGKLIIAVPNNDAVFFSWQDSLPADNPALLKQKKALSLNMPPHHMGLWNEKSLKSIQSFFPLELTDVFYEPLSNHRKILNEEILKEKIKKDNNYFGLSMLYRIFLKIKYRKNLRLGDSILVVYKKK